MIVPAFKKIDLKNLQEKLNTKKLEFVKQEEMYELLQAVPGNLSVFNLIYDKQQQVELVLDNEIFDKELVAFHPLYQGMSIFMKPKEVSKFLRLVNHSYQIENIKGKEFSYIENKEKSLQLSVRNS